MKRVAGVLVFAGSTAIGFKVGSFLPSNQYPKPEFTKTLQTHPYVARLVEQGWVPHTHQIGEIPSFHEKNMVLTGLLGGQGKFEAAPVSLTKGDEHQTVYWLGDDLGQQHEAPKKGFFKSNPDESTSVHNGIALLMLDHNLAQTALTGGKRALTKSLEARFISDIKPGVVVLKSQQTELRRRSATAEGTIYQVDGDQLGRELVSGNVLMVRPKWAPKWAP